jgi:thioredoxin 1
LKPQVEALAEELNGRVDFYKIEIGPNRQFLIELNISGFPTFLFYRQGQKSSVLAGRNILLDEIKVHIEKLLTPDGDGDEA